MTTIAPEQTGFELERFQFAGPDRLEVEGRWFGVRGRRFVRPVLTVQVRGRRRRLLASLEHKPWTADEGQMWIAAFPWRGSQEDVSGGELEVGALTVELPAPGGAAKTPAPKDQPAATDEPSAEPAAAVEPEEREPTSALRSALETRQQLERDLAGARAELARVRGRQEEQLSAVRAEATAAAEEADRLRAELERVSAGTGDVERLREAETAAREDAERKREEAAAAKDQAERHRAEASEVSSELEAARAAADSATQTAAQTEEELERLRESAARAEELRAEAERLREENREATAEIQRLRQTSRRATAEAERLRAAAARPSAPMPRRPTPEPPPPAPDAEAAPAEERAEPSPPPPPRKVISDPTVAFDALADEPAPAPAPEPKGPPPSVRRIPPREPGTRPDTLDVIRPMSERSQLQIWGTRIVALVLVFGLLLALILILTSTI